MSLIRKHNALMISAPKPVGGISPIFKRIVLRWSSFKIDQFRFQTLRKCFKHLKVVLPLHLR